MAKTQAQKEAKAREKARDKAQRKAVEEAKKQAKQRVIAYDAEGNRIGDDGYPMTKARKHLHRLYDCYFIYMIVVFLVAIVCLTLAFFQGQQLTEWELVAYGGNMFHGMSVASLLRVEALYLLFMTAASLFANMKGMAWLYDGADLKPVRNTTYVIAIISVAYFFGFLYFSWIPDPFAIIAMIMAFLVAKFVPAVEDERPRLKKAKVARTEVK